MRRSDVLVLCAACSVGPCSWAAAEPVRSQETASPPETTSVAAAARWSPSGAVSERGYQWSLSRGAIDLGLRFDARPAAPHPADARFDSAAPPGSTLPALSLGLRSVSTGPASASSLAERALGAATALPYVSRLGIEWKPAQSRVFVNQGLGLRLGADDRLTMRLRKGSLGIYLKSDF